MDKCELIADGDAIAVKSPGLFTVSKIFAWEDVRDAHGRVLVVSWKQGDDKFSEVWA